jgi:hypothetical protein
LSQQLGASSLSLAAAPSSDGREAVASRPASAISGSSQRVPQASCVIRLFGPLRVREYVGEVAYVSEELLGRTSGPTPRMLAPIFTTSHEEFL